MLSDFDSSCAINTHLLFGHLIYLVMFIDKIEAIQRRSVRMITEELVVLLV